ncbi:MAG TPA: hypothetical protein VH143_34520 [Kofleriaceae bacterium]|jgi:hypothetical protein|nr:hypothetical protein [Kofleriaceae bacterium]
MRSFRARAGLVAAVFACRPLPSPILAARGEHPAAAARTSVDAAQQLAALSVTDEDFYRPVLYTWTTAAAIAKLRGSHQLLVATIATGGFVSPYLRALTGVAHRGGPGRDVARMLLTSSRLSRRRYAWPAPFATVLGLGPRTYGSEVIRVELKRDAWVGRFEPAAADPFRFVDATNVEVPIADVVAHPERIGAMFHVQPHAAVPFREFVICNPAMVASWQVATPAVRDELETERAMIEALAHDSSTAWIRQWHAALAFDNARYRPTPDALDALAKTLAADAPTGAPLTNP